MLGVALVSLASVAVIVTYVHVVCPAERPVLLETLPPLATRAAPAGTLESASIDGVPVPLQRKPRFSVSGAGSIEIRGRARDPLSAQMGAAVFAVVRHGSAFRGRYVPSARGGGTYAVILQAAEIGTGLHEVELRVVASDRTGYYPVQPTLTVAVR